MKCPRCNAENLTEEDFGKDRSRPNGRNCYCKACVSALQKEKRARHTPEQKAHGNALAREYRARKTPEQRAAKDARYYQRKKENPEYLKSRSEYKRAREADRKRMLDMLKLERGCYDCGNRALPPEALEWDHVRGKKLFNIGGPKTRKLNAIFDEIAKCDCVCANCHRARTTARRKALDKSSILDTSSVT